MYDMQFPRSASIKIPQSTFALKLETNPPPNDKPRKDKISEIEMLMKEGRKFDTIIITLIRQQNRSSPS